MTLIYPIPTYIVIYIILSILSLISDSFLSKPVGSPTSYPRVHNNQLPITCYWVLDRYTAMVTSFFTTAGNGEFFSPLLALVKSGSPLPELVNFPYGVQHIHSFKHKWPEIVLGHWLSQRKKNGIGLFCVWGTGPLLHPCQLFRCCTKIRVSSIKLIFYLI